MQFAVHAAAHLRPVSAPMRASQRPFWCLVTPLYRLDPRMQPFDWRRSERTSSSGEIWSSAASSALYRDSGKFVCASVPRELRQSSQCPGSVVATGSAPQNGQVVGEAGLRLVRKAALGMVHQGGAGMRRQSARRTR